MVWEGRSREAPPYPDFPARPAIGRRWRRHVEGPGFPSGIKTGAAMGTRASLMSVMLLRPSAPSREAQAGEAEGEEGEGGGFGNVSGKVTRDFKS